MAKIKIKQSHLFHLIAFVMGIVLTIISLKYIFFVDDAIIVEHRDVVFPPNIRMLYDHYLYIWPNFETTARFWLASLLLFSNNVETFVRLLFFFYYFVSFFVPYLSIYYLSNHILQLNEKKSFLISITCAVFYSFNPYFVQAYSPPYTYTLSYSLLPALVVLTLSALKSNKSLYIFLLVLITTLVITPIIRYIIFVWIITTTVTIIYLFFNYKKIGFINFFKKILYILIVFVLLNFYWILPSIISFGYKSFHPSYYIVNYEIVATFSKYYKLIDIFLSKASWWPFLRLKTFPCISDSIFGILLFVVPIFVFGSLLLFRKYNTHEKVIAIIGSIIYIIGVFLWKGLTNINSLFSKFYEFLVFSTPTSIGWMFRVPGYFGTLVVLGSMLCIAVFLSKLLKRKDKAKHVGIFLCLFLISTSFIVSWQKLTGDLDGILKKGYYFKDIKDYTLAHYNKSIIILSNYKGSFKPHHTGKSYVNLPNDVQSYLTEKLTDEKIIYYIMKIFGADAFITNKELDASGYLYLYSVSKEGIRIYLSKENNSNSIYITTKILFSSDLSNSLYGSLSLVDRQLALVNDMDKIYKDIFIINSNINGYILLKNSKLILLFDKTIHMNPHKLWSKAKTSDPWHGEWYPYLQKFSIENWQSDYGYGLVFTWAKNTKLEIPFKVDKDDNYKLFIRYFKNQKGGAIKVYLDDEPIVINTKDQLNKFVWKDLGTFKLKKGEHKIILENIKGFNAVNLFALIPENEYYKAKKEVEKLLQNKTIIYLFEAESDLYRKNAEVSKEFGGDASNGEVLKFVKDGEAWQDIEIVKNGTYGLALRGVGEFKVRIGDHEFILKSNSLNFTYTTLFDLTKGKYRLEILASKDSYLDVIWLYSTKTNQTIDQLFEVKEKPAEIINYTKINPTLWKVKVNATKPFMLSFAESYDPLWEARVYKDGKLVEKVRSIPLYSIINGFWINETGELEIVIRYTPQDWFELGLKISALTFIGCIAYLFYDWRREKGDKWTERIEERTKNLLKKIYKR